MSLYIPNFSEKLNYPMHVELNQKSVHEIITETDQKLIELRPLIRI